MTTTDKEDLFAYLAENDEVKKSWYLARQFVLNQLEGWEKDNKRHHYIFEGESRDMIAVARQVALVSHYPDFDELNGKNRTILTFVVNIQSPEAFLKKLSQKAYFWNLIKYCKYTIFDKGRDSKTIHEDSFLDIEIEIRTDASYDDKNAILITEDMISTFSESAIIEYWIDVRKAKMVNSVYKIGATLNNLPSDDPNTEERYNHALDVFCYQMDKRKVETFWNEDSLDKLDSIGIRNKLSNVFCADCFESRLRDNGNLIDHAKCEHARWNVEKLIMGFRPLNEVERYREETLFSDEKKAYRKQLKEGKVDMEGTPVHIDLCSYTELRRVDPGSMKYDCFLMLAYKHILKTTTNIKLDEQE